MMARSLLLVLVALPSAVLAWKDCTKSDITGEGPFSTSINKNFTYRGHPVYLHYPNVALPEGATGWPTVVFMHGMTLSYQYYAPYIRMYASHGFVVAFPFVKSEKKDDAVIPVTEVDATSIYTAHALLQGLANGTVQAPKDLVGAIDVEKLAVVGHSMGGENTIRAAAGVFVPRGFSPLPKGVMKVAIAQHPSLCRFPPPYPITINKKEINNASLNQPLFLFTAENDRAFLPGTPKVEKTCWDAATGSAFFGMFKKSVCEQYPECKDMSGDPGCFLKRGFVGSGHMCACTAPGVDSTTWMSPEYKWTTATLRLYLQQGNAASSACRALVWGDTPDSFRNDPTVANASSHGPLATSMASGSIVV